MATGPRIRTDLSALERAAVEGAIGRILRMGARPSQPGDGAMFDACSRIVKDILDPDGAGIPDTAPNWVRDRLKGAAGD